jgi:hypothetical protein
VHGIHLSFWSGAVKGRQVATRLVNPRQCGPSRLIDAEAAIVQHLGKKANVGKPRLIPMAEPPDVL